MIEKRLVQWYAADSGVDLDIAEREVVLVYVLRVMVDHGLFDRLAFKGGTAIRKLYLGNRGRFSLDLDFTAVGDLDPQTLVLDIVSLFHDQTYHGLAFSISSADYYATAESCGAEVTYQHQWVTDGRFGIQVSFRAQPLLPVRPCNLLRERYFDWLGVEPPLVPALDLHEIVGEKIRTAAQRRRVRDLYDLYQLVNRQFDRVLVRRIAIIKCWETNFAFDPAVFLESISSSHYDWADLQRLVRRGWEIKAESIILGVKRGYAFLQELTTDEALLAIDPYSRQQQAYQRLVDSLKATPTNQ